ncbi:MAG: RNA repair transcriptional activator RtcR [Chthoniobacterales bacterium]
MKSKSNVVFSFLGPVLDRSKGSDRWGRWRPNLGICQQKDFLVDRLELFSEHKFRALESQLVRDIAQVSPETEVVCHSMNLKNPWDFEDVYERLHLFCRDYSFDVDRKNYFAHMTTGTHVAQICLFLLTESRFLPGNLIQTRPSDAHRSDRKKSQKPGPEDAAGHIEIIDLDLSKYDRLASRFAVDQDEARDFLRSGIATRNAKFNKLIDELETVSLRSTQPILLSGPTGAGKSRLARRIYELRESRLSLEGNFVEVNCATLRGDTAMSALFGHKKGAFTGAVSERPGLLRQAHKGLLFLDEIGELGLDEQAMLLRALEEGTFFPVGSDAPAKSRFQLIAGSNRDLREEVTKGHFREDLLSRINLWSFELPALKERSEDIAPNLDYELRHYAQQENRSVSFNKEAREKFLNFAQASNSEWRGNFRDLNAAIMRLATFAPRGRITVPQVDNEIVRLKNSWQRSENEGEDFLKNFLSEKQLAEIDLFDQPQLIQVLKICQSSKSLSEAGRQLFARSRKKKRQPNDSDRLKKYLAKFKLSFEVLRSIQGK